MKGVRGRQETARRDRVTSRGAERNKADNNGCCFVTLDPISQLICDWGELGCAVYGAWFQIVSCYRSELHVPRLVEVKLTGQGPVSILKSLCTCPMSESKSVSIHSLKFDPIHLTSHHSPKPS